MAKFLFVKFLSATFPSIIHTVAKVTWYFIFYFIFISVEKADRKFFTPVSDFVFEISIFEAIS